MSPELLALLEPLAEIVAERVAARLAMRDPGDEWVDARTSGLGRAAFRRIARKGGFRVFRLGRKLVAKRSEVDAWIESQRVTFDAKRASDAADPFDAALAGGRLRAVGGRK